MNPRRDKSGGRNAVQVGFKSRLSSEREPAARGSNWPEECDCS